MRILLLLYILLPLFFISCKKKYGCVSPKAINYDPKATANDGTCWYYFEGTIKWQDKVEDSCAAAGVENVNIFLNEVLLAENVDIFKDYYNQNYSSENECDTSNWPKYSFIYPNISAYNDPFVSGYVYVKDIDGNIIFSRGASIELGCDKLVIY